MTTHELAELLLTLPDIDIYVETERDYYENPGFITPRKRVNGSDCYILTSFGQIPMIKLEPVEIEEEEDDSN